MDELIRQPRARDWALPLMAGAVLYVWASSRTEPTTFTFILTAVSAVFGLWSLGNGIHHVVVIVGDQLRESRELAYKNSQNYKLELLGRMNSEQIKAVRAGRFMIDVVPTDNGPVELIRGTNVTCYAAWYILTHSRDRFIYPINNFKTETYHLDVIGDHSTDDYTQAREFHSWLYQSGLAEWGRGNTSMSWCEGWNPQKVMDGFGWDESTYAD